MSILSNCGSSVWYQVLPACGDGFTVALPGLVPLTDYYWILTDKFQHVYSEAVTTDADGRFVISAADFPEGFFNEYAGEMELVIKGHPYYCETLGFVFCDAFYDLFVLEFKGSGPAILPCICK